MRSKPNTCVRAAVIVALVLLPGVSAAVDCKTGFVPRLAAPGDEVCVPPTTRTRTVSENVRAPLLWVPGPFGPKTCVQGYVWRAASAEDRVCVVPSVRTEAQQDNALAPMRRN